MMEDGLEHFPTTKKLHTDILEDKYGPIHSEVLEHSSSLREALLVDANNIARTYALTFFPENFGSIEIAQINSEIKNGGLIGKVFRDHGYEIRKNVVDVFIIDIPDWLKSKFDNSSDHAKARISEFYAKSSVGSPIIYGYVLEVYTPDFREPEINAVDMAQIKPSTEMLEEIGVSKEDVWESLESEDKAGDLKNKKGFKEAKMKTMQFVFQLKEKMELRLNSRK
ncbi:MAG: hypothetical protein WC858_04790 [Parcubacteria group bacterium]|jgi:hypothetical protein